MLRLRACECFVAELVRVLFFAGSRKSDDFRYGRACFRVLCLLLLSLAIGCRSAQQSTGTARFGNETMKRSPRNLARAESVELEPAPQELERAAHSVAQNRRANPPRAKLQPSRMPLPRTDLEESDQDAERPQDSLSTGF